MGQAPAPKTPAQLDAQAEVLRKLMALCHSHGIVLNLHNHTYEVENHEHDLRGTLERIPDAKLGPDLNWLVRGGEDPVDFIHRYATRIVFLHIRDQKADGTWSEALGEGSMNYPAIARALHAIPFRGDAVIELAHEKGYKLKRPNPLVTFTKDQIALVYGSLWKQRYFTKAGDDYFVEPARWDITHHVWRPYFVKNGPDWWAPFYPPDNMKRPTWSATVRAPPTILMQARWRSTHTTKSVASALIAFHATCPRSSRRLLMSICMPTPSSSSRRR